MATVTVSFTLDDHRDSEIIKWLASQPKREKSAAIRRTFREHLQGTEVTLMDVYRAVLEIEQKLQRVSIHHRAEDDGDPNTLVDPEPPDSAAALDHLGL